MKLCLTSAIDKHSRNAHLESLRKAVGKTEQRKRNSTDHLLWLFMEILKTPLTGIILRGNARTFTFQTMRQSPTDRRIISLYFEQLLPTGP